MIEVEGEINNYPITVLIDYGASYSFINSNIIERFHLKRIKYKKSWLVQLVTRAKRKINELVKYFPIDMNGIITKANVSIITLGSNCWHIYRQNVIVIDGKNNKSWLVQLATEARRKINDLVKYCPIDMNGLNTKVGVTIIPLGSYDFLIGMDWLEKHHDFLDLYNKTTTYLDEDGKQGKI